MTFPKFPPEIRSRIYANLDDISVAKDIPEVFLAIAPRLFRHLVIGIPNEHFIYDERHGYAERRLDDSPPLDNSPPLYDLSTELVQIYPDSGRFVEKLTLFPDAHSVDTINALLTQTRHFTKLEYLHISYGGYETAASLPYRNLLERVITSSERLTRITFNIQPCASLVDAGNTRLTRLDLGHYRSTGATVIIALPPTLEILSFHSWDTLHITGPTPSLRIVVIQKERVYGDYLEDIDIGHLIGSSPLLTSVGFVDSGKFIFFSCSRKH